MSRRLAAVPGVVLIALAAAMWGTDPIIRKTMSYSTSATTIVFGEHVVLVVLTLPFLLPALRALCARRLARDRRRDRDRRRRVGGRDDPLHRRALPRRLRHPGRDPEGAAARSPSSARRSILGERPRPRFAWFLCRRCRLLARQPAATRSTRRRRGSSPIIEATVAAALWALGTVLGRYVSRDLEFQHVLSLRFFFGLIASAIALPVMGADAWSNGHDSLLIFYLAVVTGLLALALYYYGLQRTPAVISSIAELTYPGDRRHRRHLRVQPAPQLVAVDRHRADHRHGEPAARPAPALDRRRAPAGRARPGLVSRSTI